MKESIKTAIIVGIIITIIGLIELVLFASFAYSRAFKIKGRIVDIIEEEAGYNETVKDKIDSEVAKIGYRLTEYGNNSCPTLEDDSEKYELVNQISNYNYCIYRTKESNEDKGIGYYYTVVTYMYFDTPMLSFSFPIRGQTKTMYNYIDR